MAVVATGEMVVTPDLKQFESNLSSSFGGAAKKAALAFGGAFAAQKAVDFLGSSIGEAREAQKVTAQTEAVIKSTGAAAGVTAKQIDQFAASISAKTGIDDEAIAKASNLLLTFTNIKNAAGENNDIFTQATKITTDMGVALGTDASGAAIQLGKALNDPVKGISALQRVGVTFSQAQKDQIKNFVETGRVADAQKVILAELSKEFGGSAAAQATAGDKAKVAFDNLKETIGTKLLPVIDKLLALFTSFIQNGDAVKAVLIALAVPVGVLVAGFIAANAPLIAITAGVALAILLFERFQPQIMAVGEVVGTVFGGIKDAIMGAFNWVKTNWPLLLAIITGPIGLAVLAVTKNFDKIKAVAQGVADAIKAAFKAVFNAIASVWNNTVGKLSFKVPSWVPGIGGKGFDVPDIPKMHEGGIFQAPFGRSEGLALLKSGERVIPAPSSNSTTLMNPGQIFRDLVIQGATVEAADRTAYAMVRELKAEQYRQGK